MGRVRFGEGGLRVKMDEELMIEERKRTIRKRKSISHSSVKDTGDARCSESLERKKVENPTCGKDLISGLRSVYMRSA